MRSFLFESILKWFFGIVFGFEVMKRKMIDFLKIILFSVRFESFIEINYSVF